MLLAPPSPSDASTAIQQAHEVFRLYSASAAGSSRIELLEASPGDDLRLQVGGLEVSIVDPLEGNPLVLAEGPASAIALAERINERVERRGGASFSELLDLIATATASTAGTKRPCHTPPPTSAPGRRRVGAFASFASDGADDDDVFGAMGACDDDDDDAADDMSLPPLEGT